MADDSVEVVERLSLLKASFDGAKMVTFVAEPSESARPGTLFTAAARDESDEVAPRRSINEPEELELVAFCATAVAARAANVRDFVYIVKLQIYNELNLAKLGVFREELWR